MEKKLEFEVKITAKDLWKFSMYHANASVMGIFNLLFTASALFLLIFRWGMLSTSYRLLLLVCALLFTVWQPLLLWNKAKKQAKTSLIRKSMHLTFDENGLKVEQDGQKVEFDWEQMRRMDRMRSMMILYMDRVHAYLIPKQTLGDGEEQLCEMARVHLPKKKRRRI